MSTETPTAPGRGVSRRWAGPDIRTRDVDPSSTTSRSPSLGISRIATGVPLVSVVPSSASGPTGAVLSASWLRNSANFCAWSRSY